MESFVGLDGTSCFLSQLADLTLEMHLFCDLDPGQ